MEQKIRQHIGVKLLAHLDAQLLRPLSIRLDSNIKRRISSNLDRGLWSENRENPWWDFSHDQYFAGQHYCAWEALFTFCEELGIPFKEQDKSLLHIWVNQAKNLHWWFPYDNICFCSERHTVCQIDGEGRLHSANGPAVEYSDGFKMWNWHGTTVPQNLIERPETLTPTEILGERNAEIMRLMIERYGMERLIQKTGAELVHSHEMGDLYAIFLPTSVHGDDYMKIVKVTCPSTGHIYWLRIPPDIDTVPEAVSWTFDIPVKKYKLIKET
jgi:hypothetical protein